VLTVTIATLLFLIEQLQEVIVTKLQTIGNKFQVLGRYEPYTYIHIHIHMYLYGMIYAQCQCSLHSAYSGHTRASHCACCYISAQHSDVDAITTTATAADAAGTATTATAVITAHHNNSKHCYCLSHFNTYTLICLHFVCILYMYTMYQVLLAVHT
jgi:hypothetical protein